MIQIRMKIKNVKFMKKLESLRKFLVNTFLSQKNMVNTSFFSQFFYIFIRIIFEDNKSVSKKKSMTRNIKNWQSLNFQKIATNFQKNLKNQI